MQRRIKRVIMLKKLFLFLFIGILLGCSFQSFAQRDTEFWFAAPDNSDVSSNERDHPILLRVSTFNEDSKIYLTQPANPLFETIEVEIPANETETITLAATRAQLTGIECRPGGEIVSYGFLLQTTTPVTAYLENSSEANPDIYSLKGRNALGMDFVIPAQRTYDQRQNSGWNQWNVIPNTFLVVATQDDTEVEITPSRNLAGGYSSGNTFMVTLNRGEVFVAQSTSRDANQHLSGSIVTSNKNIVVMVNDDSVDRPIDGPDLMGDQTIPTEMLGQMYIVVKGFLDQDRIYLHGAVDNTNVYRNGSSIPLTTLNRGDMFEFTLTDYSTFLESDQPILVYHMTGWGQVGGAVIPPIECTGSNIIAFTRSEDDDSDFGIIVITQAGNEGNFSIDGNTNWLQASDFQDVPGTSGAWKVSNKDLSDYIIENNNYSIENSSGLFHLGTITGASNSCRYGFFSNFATLNIGPDQTYCKGDTVLLDAGPGQDSYAWYKYTAPTTVIGTESSIEVSDTGKYFCVATYEMCTPSDTIHLAWHADPMPNLGPDTTACLGTLVDFYPGTFSAYEWFDGSTNYTLSCDTAKLIWVKVFDSFGCHNSDTVEMFLYPQPAPVPIFHD